MSAPPLHFVIGSTGAGKTTYARRLCDEIGAARFAIDEWMSALFWMDSPQPIDPAWAIARVDRCAALIWRIALDVAHRGTPCVLEIGLTTRARRMQYAGLAAAGELACRFHLLDVPAEIRWQRVATRNRSQDANVQLDFAVTREMFDYVEAMWEAPDADERTAYDMIDAAS